MMVLYRFQTNNYYLYDMDNLKYNDRTGEFVEVKGSINRNNSPITDGPRNSGNSSSLFLGFLGVIGIALIIWIMYNQGVFDNNSFGFNKQNMNMHGYIGKYPVTMQLTISSSVVEGSYFYDSESSTLLLSGTNDDGDITLHETTAQGRPTGFFHGRLSNGKFKGKFTNYKGEKFNFSILED